MTNEEWLQQQPLTCPCPSTIVAKCGTTRYSAITARHTIADSDSNRKVWLKLLSFRIHAKLMERGVFILLKDVEKRMDTIESQWRFHTASSGAAYIKACLKRDEKER